MTTHAEQPTNAAGEPKTLECVLHKTDGPIATITMNRPEKRNAQSLQMIDELDIAFRTADADPDVRVIILAGAGPAFCGGHDLREISEDPDVLERRSTLSGTYELEREYYLERCLTIRDVSKPTIAMVQGACMSGGMMTAAMCDLIVAAEDARFADPVLGMALDERGHPRPASAVGGELVGGSPGVEVLFHPWQLGARKAKEFLFTGQWMTAEDACRSGFVNRVVPVADLETETLALARTIAAMSPKAVRLAKKSINQMLDLQGQRHSFEYAFVVHELSHGGV